MNMMNMEQSCSVLLDSIELNLKANMAETVSSAERQRGNTAYEILTSKSISTNQNLFSGSVFK